jgi:hypothetical protein
MSEDIYLEEARKMGLISSSPSEEEIKEAREITKGYCFRKFYGVGVKKLSEDPELNGYISSMDFSEIEKRFLGLT